MSYFGACKSSKSAQVTSRQHQALQNPELVVAGATNLELGPFWLGVVVEQAPESGRSEDWTSKYWLSRLQFTHHQRMLASALQLSRSPSFPFVIKHPVKTADIEVDASLRLSQFRERKLNEGEAQFPSTSKCPQLWGTRFSQRRGEASKLTMHSDPSLREALLLAVQ
jgi:hypothetical protein